MIERIKSLAGVFFKKSESLPVPKPGRRLEDLTVERIIEGSRTPEKIKKEEELEKREQQGRDAHLLRRMYRRRKHLPEPRY